MNNAVVDNQQQQSERKYNSEHVYVHLYLHTYICITPFSKSLGTEGAV